MTDRQFVRSYFPESILEYETLVSNRYMRWYSIYTNDCLTHNRKRLTTYRCSTPLKAWKNAKKKYQKFNNQIKNFRTMENQITKGTWKPLFGNGTHFATINTSAMCRVAQIEVGAINEQSGYAPINEAQANAEAICNAVNFTYGKGINPEAIPDMLEALKGCMDELSLFIGDESLELEKGNKQSNPREWAYHKAKSAIEKATIK